MSGMFTAARPLTVSGPAIPMLAGKPALVPLKLQGFEGINSLFEYKLTLQTPDALNYMGRTGSNFPLDGFLGLEVTCSIELEGHGQFVAGVAGGQSANQGAGMRHISGLVADSCLLGEDHRHAIYELTIRPWLYLATLTTDCKVFQDLTPIEIIESVLADYNYVHEKRLVEKYLPIDCVVQYNETDFEFITRLMQEFGINYHFEHSGAVHRLIWSDHNGAFQVTQQDYDKGVGAYHQIPYYPPGHKTDREYIHAFTPLNRLTSGAYASRDYDYTRPRATLEVKDAAPRNTGHANAELYLWRGDKQNIGGSHYSQPNAGADKSANQTAEERARDFARIRLQAGRQTGQRAIGEGHLRGMVPGCTFELTEHPQDKANTEHIVLSTHLVVENVGEDSQRLATAIDALVSGATGSNSAQDGGHPALLSGAPGQSIAGGAGLMRGTAKSANTPGTAAALAGDAGGGTSSLFVGGFEGHPSSATIAADAPVVAMSDAQRLTGQWRVHVNFAVQPTTEPLRPICFIPRPKTGGPETALVVGPNADTAESNIYTDTLGRIKVQFYWDRYGQKNQNSSCWLRVAQPWAGNQLGAMHIPRIGQEVLVDFYRGDPSMPFVKASVHNGANMPPWSQPDQQALSGFRSRELTPGGGNSAAGRSNHLILDDTNQKIQAQLKSDHLHSSLSLGHISRIEDNAGRKDPRGEGFELRTDGHGVMRAKDGMLISTEGRINAQSYAKDMGETTQRLNLAHDQHAQLGDLATQLQAQEKNDQGNVAKALQQQNQGIEGKGAGKGADANANKGTKDNTNFPELSAPHLVLASPAGMESTTAGSTHQHSAAHHAITSGLHTSISAGKSLLASALGAGRIFAGGGIKLWSAESKIDIAATRKSFNAIAKMGIYHTADTIGIRAKERLDINGGGSGGSWSDERIALNTTGEHRIHAANHGHPEARSAPPNIPPAHVSEAPEQSLRFAPLGADSTLKDVGYEGAPFAVHGADGSPIASGTVSGSRIQSREPYEDQDKLTLTVGKNDIAAYNLPFSATPIPVDDVEPEPEASAAQLEALTQSPYFQATMGNALEPSAMGSVQLAGLLNLAKHASAEKVRGGHHE